ncbi:MAG: hypothetical protein LBP65_00920 [Puniceicoccales bacterium]|nr:hypothetical protein [Puniceicoccales bacterium]
MDRVKFLHDAVQSEDNTVQRQALNLLEVLAKNSPISVLQLLEQLDAAGHAIVRYAMAFDYDFMVEQWLALLTDLASANDGGSSASRVSNLLHNSDPNNTAPCAFLSDASGEGVMLQFLKLLQKLCPVEPSRVLTLLELKPAGCPTSLHRILAMHLSPEPGHVVDLRQALDIRCEISTLLKNLLSNTSLISNESGKNRIKILILAQDKQGRTIDDLLRQ